MLSSLEDSMYSDSAFVGGSSLIVYIIIIALTALAMYILLKKAEESVSIVWLIITMFGGIFGMFLPFVSILSIIGYLYFMKKLFTIAWAEKVFVIFVLSYIVSVFAIVIALLTTVSSVLNMSLGAAGFGLGLAILGVVLAAFASVLTIIMNYKLAKSFGYGTIFAAITMFFPVIQYLILAFGGHEYLQGYGEDELNNSNYTNQDSDW